MTNESFPDLDTSLDGEDTAGLHPTLVVYHRDGIEIVPLVGPIVIGRTEPSDIRPRSRRLSRRHARFELVNGEVWVEDLRSTNGTFLNGVRITEPSPVGRGDEVTLGAVTVSVHAPGEAWLSPLGFEGHERFEELVTAELERGRTFQRPLAVAMFRTRDPGGPRLGAWVQGLAERLRAVDRAALFGPDCVEVLLPEMDAVQAKAFAEGAIEALANRMALGVGIASWPGSAGGSTGELIEAARTAVTRTSAESPVEVFREQTDSFGTVEEQGPVVRDPAMAALYRTVDRVASSQISVLIVGETGTGKELIARAIHERSERRDGPLKVINCGAIPANLLESILFGHERGSFTGADQRRIGVFEEASGGTVFLDEVGELPLLAQVALLRVLETRTITRVGGSHEIPADVRVIAATHRDLDAMCGDGRFRWDLLYRMNGITLAVPPLRARSCEIRPLVTHFVRESNRTNGRTVTGISPHAMALLERYAWPGNVRELRNTIDRAVVIASSDGVTVDDLPERLVASVDLSRLATEVGSTATPTLTSADATPLDLKERVRTFEIGLIEAALAKVGGNQTSAAALLAMPRRTLVYKLRAYGIRAADEQDDDADDEPPGERLPLRGEPPPPALVDPRGRPLDFSTRIERFEREIIQEALTRAGGDQGAAARMLNIQRRTLAQKLERHGL